MPMTGNQKVGNLGERISSLYLVSKGFSFIERNYWKPCGEIDIIMKKDRELYFIEVKTVSCETRILPVTPETKPHFFTTYFFSLFDSILPNEYSYVVYPYDSNTMGQVDEYKPEDNLHTWKLKRMRRVIDKYLEEKKLVDYDWNFIALTVRLDRKKKRAFIECFDEMVL